MCHRCLILGAAGSFFCYKSTMLIVKGNEVFCQRIYDSIAAIPVIALSDPDTGKVLLTKDATQAPCFSYGVKLQG